MFKQRFQHIVSKLLIFSLILGWIFSGWPRIWNNPLFPPRIDFAYAAITVASKTTGRGTTATPAGTFSVSKPATVSNTDYLVVIIGKDDDPTVSAPAGWTTGHAYGDSGGNDRFTGIYYKKITDAAGEPSTYTFTGDAGEEYNYWIGSLSGIDQTTPEDVAFNGRWVEILNDTTPDAALVTTVTNGAFVLAGIYVNADVATTQPGAPWDSRADDIGTTNGLNVMSQTKATAGDTTPATISAVTSGADSHTGQFAFRPAAANTAPTGSFNSASQQTDGSGDVDISIEIDDANDNDTKVKIAYEADNTCDSFSDLTLDQTAGATADFSDSGGTPSVVNTDSYQVGTTADRRVITSSGSNTVTFVWNSATDQASGDTTMCLQQTANDDTADQATPDTQTLTIDNVDPSAPGNLTENNRRATQITLSYGSVSSDTNDPGTNNYRLFYKAGTSGVAESDTEWDSADFDAWNYGGSSSVTITGLTANTDYVFNIWSHDTYCQTTVASCTQNRTAASEITLKTRTGILDTTASTSQSFNAPLDVIFTSQTSTMSDIGAIKIVDDRGSSAGWTVNLTANDWKTTTGAMQLDYDGTGSNDNLGKLCAFPGSATLYVESGSLTGVSKGENDCFGASVQTIDVATASATNGTGTYWLTDMALEQYFPSNPTAEVYTTTIIYTVQ